MAAFKYLKDSQVRNSLDLFYNIPKDRKQYAKGNNDLIRVE